jgi:hypothetical protein
MMANIQRENYNSLATLFKEYQQLTINDRETRNQLLQSILTSNPSILSKAMEENVFKS